MSDERRVEERWVLPRWHISGPEPESEPETDFDVAVRAARVKRALLMALSIYAEAEDG